MYVTVSNQEEEKLPPPVLLRFKGYAVLLVRHFGRSVEQSGFCYKSTSLSELRVVNRGT